MTNNRFGATSWDEVEVKQAKKPTRDQFMRLENGSNVVRVITQPHEYLVHRVKLDPSDPGFGERIMSSQYHGRDPLMEPPYSSKPKRRWYVGVIDRKTQSYKILDMSVQVFKGIQELVRDEDWGNPNQYDIDIKVDKSAGPSAYYSVIPKSKKPLSPADLEIKQNVDLDELKRKCTPPTPEQVEQRIAALKARKAGAATGTTAATSMSTVDTSDDSSDDFDFPAVN